MGLRRIFLTGDNGAVAFDTVDTFVVQKGSLLKSVHYGQEIFQGSGKYVLASVYDGDSATCSSVLPTTSAMSSRCIFHRASMYVSAGTSYYVQMWRGEIFSGLDIPINSGNVTIGMKSDTATGIGVWWISIVVDEKLSHPVDVKSTAVK